MGIAASQARFLAITSRKANCEFESMRIAQQKLSVTRELSAASDKYQQSLNATKLVWDTSGDGSQTFDLTYDMMMTPSVMNGYDPYLVTDAKTGQVTLNTKMANAAKAAGIGENGAVRSEAGRNKFVQELANQGYISGSMSTKIQTNPYSKSAGMGGELIDKTAANAVSSGTFTNYLAEAEGADGKKLYALKLSDLGISNFHPEENASDTYQLAVNGQILQDFSGVGNLTIADLLQKNYVLLKATPDNGSADDLKDGFGSTINKFIDQISGQFGYGKQNTLLNTDDESNKALNYAYSKVHGELFNANNWQYAGKPDSTRESFRDAANKANNSNSIVYTSDGDLNKKENAHIAVSLTNIVKSFLTAYAQALTGYTGGYSVNKDAKLSNYVTDDPSYYFVLNNENAVTEKDLLITDFYNVMYNNICSKGWSENTNMNDKDYLQHALKNGQLFVASLASDGYYYQAPYVQSGFYSQGPDRGAYVAEVTDNDAISQAEAKYTKEKNKLNYKEQSLELDMKNLDTELSSLTTEYDTVKNLISKNVEKIFNMFQT